MLHYSSKSDAGNAAFAKALSRPDLFVVKPQREGGGNNVYGEDIVPFLQSIEDSNERNAYILMDRIHPPKTINYMIRPGSGKATMKSVISELGIFGYVIGDHERIISNQQVGYRVTKQFDTTSNAFYFF